MTNQSIKYKLHNVLVWYRHGLSLLSCVISPRLKILAGGVSWSFEKRFSDSLWMCTSYRGTLYMVYRCSRLIWPVHYLSRHMCSPLGKNLILESRYLFHRCWWCTVPDGLTMSMWFYKVKCTQCGGLVAMWCVSLPWASVSLLWMWLICVDLG